MDLLYKDITNKVIKTFYKVYNDLGFGFLEKVYENALFYELLELGLKCEKQKPVKAHYKGNLLGEYFADIIVYGCVIIELKAAESIIEAHEIQLLNYLKATEIEVGFLLNFGKEPSFRRKLYTNDTKNFNLNIRIE